MASSVCVDPADTGGHGHGIPPLKSTLEGKTLFYFFFVIIIRKKNNIILYYQFFYLTMYNVQGKI